MSTKPLRAAFYARQSVREDEGIEQQIAHCLNLANAHGWEVVGTFTDNQTSATRERGPSTGWGRLLAAHDSGAFDVVLCVSVDRLLRRVVDIVELRSRRVRIVTARDGIDTSTPMGGVILTILTALAEAEIETKKARNIPYANARRAQGHPWPGRTPHGYRWVPKSLRNESGQRWTLDDAEAADVRRIYDEALADAPLGQIGRDLNTDGRWTRAGAKWGTSTIRRVLLSPFYAGLLPPAQGWADFDPARVVIEECTPGAWEPIIGIDEYLAIRSRLLAVAPNHNGTARKWLLSGLAICGVCEEPVRSSRTGTHRTHHGYRCRVGHFMRGGDVIDWYVSEVVIARLSRPDAIELLAPAEGPDIVVLHAQRKALEGRDAAIARLIASGRLTPKAAEESLDALAAELRSLNDSIAAAMRADPLAEVVNSEDVRAWWDGATLARRRAIVETLLTPVIRRVGMGYRANEANVGDTVGIEWRAVA